ncbi:cell division protein CrgA [Kocuria sp.]|uniref:cell division protein CrgA n=1 Tax=Kocuria sp. TaxID=1871328 RepID=UPI0026DC04B2|nr:cell division protein CrgA [Kocuria sp.]MDO4920125.1 cell division protein CrgA [Kocuria sp.]
MSQPKKRFGRSRGTQDDTQQFTLTERDRELAALAAEILPRNSAAASFERAASRKAGSSSVSARDAVTDTAPDDDAATGSASDPADTPVPATTEGGAGGTTPRKGHGAKKTGRAASPSAAGKTTAGAATATEAEEDTPTEATDGASAEDPKARKKRERQAKRREAKAARAEARERRSTDYQPTPLWYKVIMIGLMIVGLLWIISYYLFQGQIPIPGIGVWNLIIGLGFMFAGLIMTTRWR